MRRLGRVDLAAKLDCATLGVSHFTNGTAGVDPLDRVNGSLAFGALACVVMVAAKVQKNTNEPGSRRILARAKSNIGQDAGGYGYDLEQVEESSPIVTAAPVVCVPTLAGREKP